MKIKYLIIFLFVCSFVFGQKTCKKKPILEDLNAIAKCDIVAKKSKDQNSLNFLVSASRKHHLKLRSKRKISKKIENFSEKLSKEKVMAAKKFNEVDLIPAFSSCKDFRDEERSKCFNNTMSKHINKHFYYPLDAVQKNIQGKVWIRFIINSTGKLSNLKIISRHKEFKYVALEIMSKLPSFVPGKKDGKPVSVKYSFPISFSLKE